MSRVYGARVGPHSVLVGAHVGERNVLVSDKIEHFGYTTPAVGVGVGVPLVAGYAAKVGNLGPRDHAKIVVLDVIPDVEREPIPDAVIRVRGGSQFIAVCSAHGVAPVVDVTLHHPRVGGMEPLRIQGRDDEEEERGYRREQRDCTRANTNHPISDEVRIDVYG